jgi:hypothetical protein
MRRVVIGIPARNEAANIGRLSDRLDLGASLLGEVATCELVLAYQSSDDDTLEQWQSRPRRLPSRVLTGLPGITGKGHNVKLLIDYCRSREADLLLVDADLREYPELNLGRFVAAAHDNRFDLVLPLWSRQWGQGNTTNYVAAPLLRAVYGAQVRQPLAGHMFLSRRLIDRLVPETLPDDYGIDVTITMAALSLGGAVGQVVMPELHHDPREGNSERIMLEVTRAALGALAAAPTPWRGDVQWPTRYWERLEWPDDGTWAADVFDAAPRDWSGPATRATGWDDFAGLPPEAVAQVWCGHLATAVRRARNGHDVAAIASDLAEPFFAHAEYRRRQPRPAVAQAEAYVIQLGECLEACLR